MDHSDSIVRRNSYIVTVNPEVGVLIGHLADGGTKRNEPYVLLFSCKYKNGSRLMSQWKRTPGLQKVVRRIEVPVNNLKGHTRPANSTGNPAVMGGDRRTRQTRQYDRVNMQLK